MFLGDNGQKILLLDAYPHRGRLLQTLSLYDYASVVQLRRKGHTTNGRGYIEFDDAFPFCHSWIQQLRKPGQHATICLDGYLGMDFDEEEDQCYRRYLRFLCY